MWAVSTFRCAMHEAALGSALEDLIVLVCTQNRKFRFSRLSLRPAAFSDVQDRIENLDKADAQIKLTFG